jgi:hypothetical protein
MNVFVYKCPFCGHVIETENFCGPSKICGRCGKPMGMEVRIVEEGVEDRSKL